MGTTYSIKCWSGDAAADGSNLQKDIEQLLHQVNQQMSTYAADSELSQFNTAPAGEWFDVSPATAMVVARAIDIHKRTAGASDVTVGPLVNLWDFGPSNPENNEIVSPPTDEQIVSAKAISGCEYLEARSDPPSLKKTLDGLYVDLSSIAKGYAVDAVAEVLEQRGFNNFMVEIGGEVRAAGSRLDGKPWRIAVEKPNPDRRQLHTIVALKNQALATSGDYRNFREFDGQTVSHIIDPATGRPLPYRGWSVTLLTPSCLEADALATALLVMGEDRGYDWCEEYEVAALFLIKNGNGVVERATSKFPKLIPLKK